MRIKQENVNQVFGATKKKLEQKQRRQSMYVNDTITIMSSMW